MNKKHILITICITSAIWLGAVFFTYCYSFWRGVTYVEGGTVAEAVERHSK